MPNCKRAGYPTHIDRFGPNGFPVVVQDFPGMTLLDFYRARLRYEERAEGPGPISAEHARCKLMVEACEEAEARRLAAAQ